MKRFFIFIILNFLLLTGCSTTLFQKEVPAPIPNTDIAVYSSSQERLYNLNEDVSEGRTPKPITTNEIDLNRRVSEELIEQNSFFSKYQGKPIEGTGIDLSKPITLFWIIGGILLISIFPQILPLFIQGSRRTMKGIIDSIEVSQDHETIRDLKNKLSARLSADDKILISKIKHK